MNNKRNNYSFSVQLLSVLHFCECRRKMQPPVHAGGAWCGRNVPGGDFCPQIGYLLWTPEEKCSRLSTQGCLVWTQGARRLLLSTEWVSFVDAEGKCNRLSTQGVPGVDARCREVSFVHRMGIFCGCRRKMQPPVHKMALQRGRKVPGGDFCLSLKKVDS